MMFLISGPLDVCATSKVAKTVLISNPKTSTDGSGPPIGRSWPQPVKCPPALATTPGLPPATRSKSNPTTPNLISMVPLNRV
ncbi:hypothetical protein D910_04477 [Dendroctonus ponderosae]|uniref:Uncharacterized protein n=1 Tax=Dendroctonus ponderosae TaxID=77166 RepID=U4U8X9_DENPD|nr:hypothetical protein D910_04477 [Dendroctonus ponderosae]